MLAINIHELDAPVVTAFSVNDRQSWSTSAKVVVGVTSRDRSFAMAQQGCYGPGCEYTGSNVQSNAKKGKCTNTSGYISNAEIGEMIKKIDSGRVNQDFIDKTSHSNILVYDNTE